MKLFKVICWYDCDSKIDTFANFVIAENSIEAKRIVEEEVWTLDGMKIKDVEEIDMSYSKLLCSVDIDDAY